MWKSRHLPVLICSFLFSHFELAGQVLIQQKTSQPVMEASTVVVSDPQDPYHALALEISQTETIPHSNSIEQALSQEPRFILWVGSPRSFTDKVLTQFGLMLKARHSRTSTGLISGNSVADARALWQRGKRAGGVRVYAVNGEYPPAQVMRGRILTPTPMGVAGKGDLNKSELNEALQTADYLTFTGHGGGAYWRLAAGVTYTASDLPHLPPLVLATAGCQGIRLNLGNSIALAAVAQGAAAYAGFLFSPIEGYLIGEFDGLPFRNTWPGVTIGEVIQMQNRGEMQGATAWPFYLLLGDPRIALQPDASWAPLEIETARGVRTYNFGETPPGFFPIRIKDGAQYHFIEIPELAAASDYDLFYNSRLQMMNSGADKLLLVLHPGGELKIAMRPEPPRFWRLTDLLLDSLDHTLIFIGGGSPWVSIFTGGIALLGIVVLLRKHKSPRSILMRSILVGLAMGLGQVLYVSLRINHVTITTKPLSIGPADIVATALLASCGTVLFARYRSPLRKILGVVVAVFPGFGAAALSAVFFSVFNTFYARPALGAGIYSYSVTFMALIGMTCEAVVFALLVFLLGRIRGKPSVP